MAEKAVVMAQKRAWYHRNRIIELEKDRIQAYLGTSNRKAVCKRYYDKHKRDPDFIAKRRAYNKRYWKANKAILTYKQWLRRQRKRFKRNIP